MQKAKSTIPVFFANVLKPVIVTVVLALLVTLSPNPANAGNPNPGILPPHANAFGKSYGEWSAAWWQWALSMPVTGHPLFDDTGINAAAGQSGNVWFLGGTYTAVTEGNVTIGTVTRDVTLPPGKALFFPIINTENDNFTYDPPLNQQGLESDAAWIQDQALNLWCTIDGVPVRGLSDPIRTPYRVQSHLFKFTLPVEDNLYQGWGYDVAGPVPKPGAVADGVFLMLAPLAPGSHVIQFGGEIIIPDWDYHFQLDITYNLTVLPAALEILPPDRKAYGKTYGEWAALWQQWAFGIPAAQNPLTDSTGEFCDVDQAGPVWFLAGNFGGTTERYCTVPERKALFFPVINSFYVKTEPEEPTDRAEIRALLHESLAGATYACEIDGQAVEHLEAYFTDSPLFTTSFPADNFFGLSKGHYQPSMNSGWYLMLPPLAAGEHTIHFAGTVPAWEMSLDVTYHLDVGKEDHCSRGHSAGAFHHQYEK